MGRCCQGQWRKMEGSMPGSGSGWQDSEPPLSSVAESQTQGPSWTVLPQDIVGADVSSCTGSGTRPVPAEGQRCEKGDTQCILGMPLRVWGRAREAVSLQPITVVS